VAGWPSLSFHTTGALAPTGSPSPFCSGPYALAAFLLTLSSTIRARKQRTSSSSCLMADTHPPWGATLERSLTLHTERELGSPTGARPVELAGPLPGTASHRQLAKEALAARPELCPLPPQLGMLGTCSSQQGIRRGSNDLLGPSFASLAASSLMRRRAVCLRRPRARALDRRRRRESASSPRKPPPPPPPTPPPPPPSSQPRTP